MNKYVIAKCITGEEIKALRQTLNMTQREFAGFAGCSVPTVERWESGKKEITGPIVTLAELLKRDNEIPEKLEIPSDRLKLRLFYMYENMVCTIIDVDEVIRKVRIKNYTDNLLFRAFGRNTEPSFDDYESFIRSRCFPESRDKLKLELKRLDIPFYDPIMIIEKTGGRMADDHFWIRIER
ncbi:MAG: type II toxin-antitoxin system MqsA family antitoxin [Lachnospiraceae bacterium]|nr:type II toxin-antitoxin system MqsA family antitoxin [Lachnospiraceae bacterium]